MSALVSLRNIVKRYTRGKQTVEVLHALKKDPNTRDIPVIMLTAKAQDADVFNGYRSGADCYLTKPFNPLELTRFVKRIFDSFEMELEGGRRPIVVG